MPSKGGNTKKESRRAKKAENEAKKAAAAEVDKVHTPPLVQPRVHQCLFTISPKLIYSIN